MTNRRVEWVGALRPYSHATARFPGQARRPHEGRSWYQQRHYSRIASSPVATAGLVRRQEEKEEGELSSSSSEEEDAHFSQNVRASSVGRRPAADSVCASLSKEKRDQHLARGPTSLALPTTRECSIVNKSQLLSAFTARAPAFQPHRTPHTLKEASFVFGAENSLASAPSLSTVLPVACTQSLASQETLLVESTLALQPAARFPAKKGPTIKASSGWGGVPRVLPTIGQASSQEKKHVTENAEMTNVPASSGSGSVFSSAPSRASSPMPPNSSFPLVAPLAIMCAPPSPSPVPLSSLSGDITQPSSLQGISCGTVSRPLSLEFPMAVSGTSCLPSSLKAPLAVSCGTTTPPELTSALLTVSSACPVPVGSQATSLPVPSANTGGLSISGGKSFFPVRKEADSFLSSLHIPLLPATTCTPSAANDKEDAFVIKFGDSSESEDERLESETTLNVSGTKTVQGTSSKGRVQGSSSVGVQPGSNTGVSQKPAMLQSEIDRMRKQIAAMEQKGKAPSVSNPSKAYKSFQADSHKQSQSMTNVSAGGGQAGEAGNLENLRLTIRQREHELELERKRLGQISHAKKRLGLKSNTASGAVFHPRKSGYTFVHANSSKQKGLGPSEGARGSDAKVIGSVLAGYPISTTNTMSKVGTLKTPKHFDTEQRMSAGYFTSSRVFRMDTDGVSGLEFPTNQPAISAKQKRARAEKLVHDIRRLEAQIGTAKRTAVDGSKAKQRGKRKSDVICLPGNVEDDEAGIGLRDSKMPRPDGLHSQQDAADNRRSNNEGWHHTPSQLESSIPGMPQRMLLYTRGTSGLEGAVGVASSEANTTVQVTREVHPIRTGINVAPGLVCQTEGLTAVRSEISGSRGQEYLGGDDAMDYEGDHITTSSARAVFGAAKPDILEQVFSTEVPAISMMLADQVLLAERTSLKATSQRLSTTYEVHAACPSNPVANQEGLSVGLRDFMQPPVVNDRMGSKLNRQFDWEEYFRHLQQEEELIDTQLEEVQDSRRLCEVKDRAARKAYRETQRALHAANLRCDYLHQKRERVAAEIREAEIQHYSARAFPQLPSFQCQDPSDMETRTKGTIFYPAPSTWTRAEPTTNLSGGLITGNEYEGHESCLSDKYDGRSSGFTFEISAEKLDKSRSGVQSFTPQYAVAQGMHGNNTIPSVAPNLESVLKRKIRSNELHISEDGSPILAGSQQATKAPKVSQAEPSRSFEGFHAVESGHQIGVNNKQVLTAKSGTETEGSLARLAKPIRGWRGGSDFSSVGKILEPSLPTKDQSSLADVGILDVLKLDLQRNQESSSKSGLEKLVSNPPSRIGILPSHHRSECEAPADDSVEISIHPKAVVADPANLVGYAYQQLASGNGASRGTHAATNKYGCFSEYDLVRLPSSKSTLGDSLPLNRKRKKRNRKKIDQHGGMGSQASKIPRVNQNSPLSRLLPARPEIQNLVDGPDQETVSGTSLSDRNQTPGIWSTESVLKKQSGYLSCHLQTIFGGKQHDIDSLPSKLNEQQCIPGLDQGPDQQRPHQIIAGSNTNGSNRMTASHDKLSLDSRVTKEAGTYQRVSTSEEIAVSKVAFNQLESLVEDGDSSVLLSNHDHGELVQCSSTVVAHIAQESILEDVPAAEITCQLDLGIKSLQEKESDDEVDRSVNGLLEKQSVEPDELLGSSVPLADRKALDGGAAGACGTHIGQRFDGGRTNVGFLAGGEELLELFVCKATVQAQSNVFEIEATHVEDSPIFTPKENLYVPRSAYNVMFGCLPKADWELQPNRGKAQKCTKEAVCERILWNSGQQSYYKSPLIIYRSYRLFPWFTHSLNSLTWSHNVDCFRPLCKFEHRGVCKDQECLLQHMRNYTVDSNQILSQLLCYKDAMVSQVSSNLVGRVGDDVEEITVAVDFKTKAEAILSSIQMIGYAIIKPSKSLHHTWRNFSSHVPAYRLGSYVCKPEEADPKKIGILRAQPLVKQVSFHCSLLSAAMSRPLPLNVPCLIETGDRKGLYESSISNTSRLCDLTDGSDKQVLAEVEPNDVEHWVELALNIINFDISSEESESNATVLFTLARALELNSSSAVLWIVYLSIFIRKNGSDADNVFKAAVALSNSYELWRLFIDTRPELDQRLRSYQLALVRLGSPNVNEIDEKKQSPYLLDLALQMLYIMIISDRVESALSWIDDLVHGASGDHLPLGSRSTAAILAGLTLHDACILWTCCAYVATYCQLPSYVVSQFGCRHELPFGLHWKNQQPHSVDRVRTVLKTATSAEMGCLSLYNLASDREPNLSRQAFGVNYVQCLSLCAGVDSAITVCKRLLQLHPNCLELVVVYARFEKLVNGTESGIRVFDESIQRLQKKSGIHRIWSQYAGHVLEWEGKDAAIGVLEKYASCKQQPSCTSPNTNSSSSKADLSVFDLNSDSEDTVKMRQSVRTRLLAIVESQLSIRIESSKGQGMLPSEESAFALLNLALYEALSGDTFAAKDAVEKSVKTANYNDAEHCWKEFAAFTFSYCRRESEGRENNLFGQHMLELLDRCFAESRLVSNLESLSQIANSIKKRRVRLFVQNLLGPPPQNYSLFNDILYASFGPGMLPEGSTSFQKLSSFGEGILEIMPGNVVVALALRRVVANLFHDSTSVNADAAAVWANSLLVNALIKSWPPAPEVNWVEAADFFQRTREPRAFEEFCRHASRTYPFSAKLAKLIQPS